MHELLPWLAETFVLNYSLPNSEQEESPTICRGERVSGLAERPGQREFPKHTGTLLMELSGDPGGRSELGTQRARQHSAMMSGMALAITG